jgi:uncharacterized protein (TIGR02598 family)
MSAGTRARKTHDLTGVQCRSRPHQTARRSFVAPPVSLSPAGGGFIRSLRPATRSQSRAGFSLVEVVLAIGVMAMAFVPLFGLLPAGLTTYRGTVDTAVTSQIVQQLGNEAQQADFESVVSTESDRVRYFDDQGSELRWTGAASTLKALYQARMTVVSDTTHRKRLLIQVARNPGGTLTLTEEDIGGGVKVWSSANPLPVATRSLLLARVSSVPRP